MNMQALKYIFAGLFGAFLLTIAIGLAPQWFGLFTKDELEKISQTIRDINRDAGQYHLALMECVTHTGYMPVNFRRAYDLEIDQNKK